MTPAEILAVKAELRACSYRGNQAERALKVIIKLEGDCQTYSRTMDEISKMPLDPADAQRVIAAKDAEIARLREGVRDLIGKLDGCKRFERGSGGMTIDAQIWRTVLIDVRAAWVEEARALLENTK